jgi:hypothetical protein
LTVIAKQSPADCTEIASSAFGLLAMTLAREIFVAMRAVARSGSFALTV